VKAPLYGLVCDDLVGRECISSTTKNGDHTAQDCSFAWCSVYIMAGTTIDKMRASRKKYRGGFYRYLCRPYYDLIAIAIRWPVELRYCLGRKMAFSRLEHWEQWGLAQSGATWLETALCHSGPEKTWEPWFLVGHFARSLVSRCLGSWHNTNGDSR
jgi:hypothetical protein